MTWVGMGTGECAAVVQGEVEEEWVVLVGAMGRAVAEEEGVWEVVKEEVEV